MLLDASQIAAAAGDHAEAVVLAEELLEENPDDIEALLIVADSAPRYGHGEVGVLAARQAAQRGAETGAVEAAARLSSCDVEGALTTAEAALRRNDADARAHAIRGQALELLGRIAEGEAALARAAALRPDGYPPALDVAEHSWDPLLLAARSSMDPALRDALRNVELCFRELPNLNTLRALSPPPSPLVDGLVLDPDARRPRLELYRRNLRRGSDSLDRVEERIRDALENEAAVLLEERE